MPERETTVAAYEFVAIGLIVRFLNNRYIGDCQQTVHKFAVKKYIYTFRLLDILENNYMFKTLR